MRKVLPALFFCLLTGAMTAQTVISADYLPEIGDTLKFSTADSSTISSVTLHGTGGPYVWDLTGLSAIRTSDQAIEDLDLNTQDSIFATADAKIQTGEFSTNYYQLNAAAGMQLIGNIGGTELIEGFVVNTPFAPPYVERRSSVEFIDQNDMMSNISVSLPTDSLPQVIIDAAGALISAADSLRFRTTIERDDLVDAYGTAELGDETFDVLRERREEIRSVLIEAYNPFFGWTDITAAIALGIPGLADLIQGQDTVITYTLWSDASIDPIAVFQTENDGETISRVTYKTLPTTSSTETFIRNVAIRMYPNPARTLTTFEAEGLPSGVYQLRIMNMAGRHVISEVHNVIGNQLRSTLDVGALPSGLYLYSLTNSRGRILATKRLFVGGE